MKLPYVPGRHEIVLDCQVLMKPNYPVVSVKDPGKETNPRGSELGQRQHHFGSISYNGPEEWARFM